MAWTTPRTWLVGEIVTAAVMNAHVRDNLSFLFAATSNGWIDASAEAWTFGAADGPVYTITTPGDLTGKYQAGMRIRLTHSAAIKYFIVVAVAFSAGTTTVTLYGGTTYTLAASAITAQSFSVAKTPYGFPIGEGQWSVEVTDVSDRTQAGPVQNTWYNMGSLSISVPIGLWELEYEAPLGFFANAINGEVAVTLSNANNTESDIDMTSAHYLIGASQGTYLPHYRRKVLSFAAKTSLFLNERTITAGSGGADILHLFGNKGKTIIRAVCAYL